MCSRWHSSSLQRGPPRSSSHIHPGAHACGADAWHTHVGQPTLASPTPLHSPARRSRRHQLPLSCRAMEQECVRADTVSSSPAMTQAVESFEDFSESARHSTDQLPLLEPDTPPTCCQRINRALKSAETLLELRSVLEQEAHAFDHINTAHGMGRLAKLYKSYCSQLTAAGMFSPAAQTHAQTQFVEPCLVLLNGLVSSTLDSFDAWDTSSCLWAYATLNYFDRNLFEMLCGKAENLSEHLTPVDCANILVAFGRFGHYHPGVLKGIPQVLLTQIYDAKPSEISQVLWGYARLRVPDTPSRSFLAATCELVVSGMHEYGNQELSTVMWALVRLHHYPGMVLLQRAEAVMLRRLRHTLRRRLPPLATSQPQGPPTAPQLPHPPQSAQAYNGTAVGTSQGPLRPIQPLRPPPREPPQNSYTAVTAGAVHGMNGAGTAEQTQPQRMNDPPPSLRQAAPSQSAVHHSSNGVHLPAISTPQDLLSGAAILQRGLPPSRPQPPLEPTGLGEAGSGPDHPQQQQQGDSSRQTQGQGTSQQQWQQQWSQQPPESSPQPQQQGQQQPQEPQQQQQWQQQQQQQQQHQQWQQQQQQQQQQWQQQQQQQRPSSSGGPSRGAASVPAWVAGRGTPAPGLKPQDISNLLWAFGQLRYKAVHLLDELPLGLGTWLHTFTSTDLCALLVGYAHARHYHKGMLDAVAPLLVERVAELGPTELLSTLWAYGIFQHRPTTCPTFLPVIAGALERFIRRSRPQAHAMVAKACANLQFRPEALLQTVVRSAEIRLADFKPSEMAALLYGLSHLAGQPPYGEEQSSSYGSLYSMDGWDEAPNRQAWGGDLGGGSMDGYEQPTLSSEGMQLFYSVVRQCIRLIEEPLPQRDPRRQPEYQVLNSVVFSCLRVGYTPWTLIDFAESKGIRLVQPQAVAKTWAASAAVQRPVGAVAAAGIGLAGASRVATWAAAGPVTGAWAATAAVQGPSGSVAVAGAGIKGTAQSGAQAGAAAVGGWEAPTGPGVEAAVPRSAVQPQDAASGPDNVTAGAAWTESGAAAGQTELASGSATGAQVAGSGPPPPATVSLAWQADSGQYIPPPEEFSASMPRTVAHRPSAAHGDAASRLAARPPLFSMGREPQEPGGLGEEPAPGGQQSQGQTVPEGQQGQGQALPQRAASAPEGEQIGDGGSVVGSPALQRSYSVSEGPLVLTPRPVPNGVRGGVSDDRTEEPLELLGASRTQLATNSEPGTDSVHVHPF